MKRTFRSSSLTVAACHTLLSCTLLAGPAAAGTAVLDPSFGNNGITTVPFTVAPGSNQPRSVLVDSAGNTYVGGEVLAKYGIDGALAPSFGVGGSIFINIRISGIAEQTDGKIVVVGETALQSGGVNFAAARLMPDGQLDASFGDGGKTTPFVFSSFAADVAIASDGKVLIAGTDFVQRHFLVARYNANGTLDNTFGTGGIVNEEVGGFDSGAVSIGEAAGGRILVYGEVPRQNEPAPECFGDTDVAVVRYLSNGSRDPAFGTAGVSFVDIAGCEDTAAEMAVQADGMIVLAGHAEIPAPGDTFQEDFFLTRLAADGSLDTAFGSGGTVLKDYLGRDEDAGGMVLQPGGGILLFGEADLNTVEELRVLRYTSAGVLDTAFGNQGEATVGAGATNEFPCCIALAPTGEIVTAFRTDQPTTSSDYGVVRLLANGSPDTGFGNQSVVISDFALRTQSFTSALVEQGDGKLLQVGWIDRFALVRYNANGSLDQGFGTQGVVTSDFGVGREQAKAAVLQPDGKIVVAGDDGGETFIARYLSDGTLDADFGTAGVAVVALRTIMGAVALQSDGKIVVAGTSRTSGFNLGLIRLTTGGTLDAAFGSGGVVEVDRAGTNDLVTSLVILSDDRIIAGGSSAATFGDDFALARFSADGVLDAGFGNAGWVLTDFRGARDRMNALILASDGTLLAAGKSEDSSGLASADFALARYSIEGVLDSGFDADGKLEIAFGSIDEAVALAEDSTGDFYVVGNAAGMGTAVARLNPDGSLDTGFNGDGFAISRPFGFEAASAVVARPTGPVIGAHVTTENLIALTPQDFSVRAILSEGCSFCGHPTDLSLCRDPTATDALNALKAAVGTLICELCRCDVNDSGSTTASDALLILQNAVGQPKALVCPGC